MKNKKLILIAFSVLILFVLGFVVWGLTRKNNKNTLPLTQDQKSQETTKTADADTVKGNVFDLLKLGKSLKCTYSMDAEGISVSGTSYVSGKNMRGDFENADNGGAKIQSHMISDGTWVYSWSSASPMGFKMNISEAESKGTTTDTDTSDNQYADVFKNDLNYKCTPWIEDASLFKVPANVEFADFSKGSDTAKTMCTACNYAQSEEDKTTCKKQLGCE